MKSFSACTLLASFFALLGPLFAYAGTVEINFTQYCSLYLRGSIADGDAAKLEKAMEERDEQASKREPYQARELCLDSPDGSYAEATRIAAYILKETDIGTVVDKDASCVGPCALIFMAGRVRFENLTLPRRRLHVGGLLAFQAPGQDSSSGNRPDGLQVSYQNAVKALGALAKLNGEHKEGSFNERAFPYPRSLVAEFMKTGPGGALIVDKLQMARNWQIELIGFQMPPQLSKRQLYSACLLDAQDSQKPPQPNAQDVSDDPVVVQTGKTVRTVFKGFGRKGNEICVADIYRSPKSGLHILTSFGASLKSDRIMKIDHMPQVVDDDGERLGESTPAWLALPMDTPLKSIAAR
jgi:hypothetical protein